MSEPTYSQEYNAIVEVVNKYIEGGRKGSGATMKPAFHEKATIFGLAGEELFGPEIERTLCRERSERPFAGSAVPLRQSRYRGYSRERPPR